MEYMQFVQPAAWVVGSEAETVTTRLVSSLVDSAVRGDQDEPTIAVEYEQDEFGLRQPKGGRAAPWGAHVCF